MEQRWEQEEVEKISPANTTCMPSSCCNVKTSLFSCSSIPHGAPYTRYSVDPRTKFKFHSRKSHDHRYHQSSLFRARDGKEEKKRQKWSKEKDYAWSKMENHHAVCDCIYQYQGCLICWQVLNFAIFFPNRKNSQNIVPATYLWQVPWRIPKSTYSWQLPWQHTYDKYLWQTPRNGRLHRGGGGGRLHRKMNFTFYVRIWAGEWLCESIFCQFFFISEKIDQKGSEWIRHGLMTTSDLKSRDRLLVRPDRTSAITRGLSLSLSPPPPPLSLPLSLSLSLSLALSLPPLSLFSPSPSLSLSLPPPPPLSLSLSVCRSV